MLNIEWCCDYNFLWYEVRSDFLTFHIVMPGTYYKISPLLLLLSMTSVFSKKASKVKQKTISAVEAETTLLKCVCMGVGQRMDQNVQTTHIAYQ